MARHDICALKRLQRDAFEQMLRTSERLDALEEEMGTSGRSNISGVTLLGSGSKARSRRSSMGRAQGQLSGQLVFGGELTVLQVCMHTMASLHY